MEIIWQAHWRAHKPHTMNLHTAQVLTYCKENEVFEHAIPIFLFSNLCKLN